MLKTLLIGILHLYRRTFGMLLPKVCKYEPSCSVYMIEAIEKYGAVRGVLKGSWRLLRCNPWSRGGYDPP